MFNKSFLSLFLAVAFFLTFSSIAFADYPYRFDDRLSVVQNEYAKNDANPGAGSFGMLIDALDNAGLIGILRNLVPEFEKMVETLQGLFHAMQKERHAEDLNKILGHFRDNWPVAINRMKKLKGSSSEVDLAGFMAFMEAYKTLLDDSISADHSLGDSDVVKFMSQLTHLFNALESAYGSFYMGFKALNIPIKIDWNIFQTTNKLIQMIPEELIDAKFMSELLQAPSEVFHSLAKTIEDVNEQIRDSPIGQYVPLVLQVVENLVKNWVAQQEYHINRDAEL